MTRSGSCKVGRRESCLVVVPERKDCSTVESLTVKTDLDKQNLIQKFEKELEAQCGNE